jgi:DNA topoisomerase-2
MIIDGKLVIAKRKKADLIAELKQKDFKPFPKVSDAKKHGEDAPLADEDEESEEDVELGSDAYNYLLGVSMKSTFDKNDANRTRTLDAPLVPYKRTCGETPSTDWR